MMSSLKRKQMNKIAFSQAMYLARLINELEIDGEVSGLSPDRSFQDMMESDYKKCLALYYNKKYEDLNELLFKLGY